MEPRTPRWPHAAAKVVRPAYFIVDRGSRSPPYVPRPWPLDEAHAVLADLLAPYEAASPWRARLTVVCCPEQAAPWLEGRPPRTPFGKSTQWECPSPALIGWELRTRREDLGLPLWFLADRTGVTSGGLCHIEAGRKLPSTALLARLRAALRELEQERARSEGRNAA